MKHSSLDSPVKGKTYWVIRYQNEVCSEYPIEPEDLCVATSLGDNLWLSNWVKFKSQHYMEIPTL